MESLHTRKERPRSFHIRSVRTKVAGEFFHNCFLICKPSNDDGKKFSKSPTSKHKVALHCSVTRAASVITMDHRLREVAKLVISLLSTDACLCLG